jgi:hypothetical protein
MAAACLSSTEKTEFDETFGEATRLRLGPTTIEVSSTELFIEIALFKHVIDRREDAPKIAILRKSGAIRAQRSNLCSSRSPTAKSSVQATDLAT